MKQRIFFFAVLTFWLVMNGLLWRFEYGARQQLGAPVPAAMVWQRMLTAADSSALEIHHRDQKLGLCRWTATVGEDRRLTEPGQGPATPDGMVREVTGYTIDFDGNLMLREFGQNVRFYFRLNLATNHAWRDLNLRMTLKPDTYEIRADAQRQTLTIRLDDGESQSEQVYRFEELADPRRVLRDFEVPLPVEWLMSAVVPVGYDAAKPDRAPTLSLALPWEARHDTFKFGSASVRVYRVQARLLDRYYLTAYVSRAGEILRVELPGDITLVNYALSSY
jgi:hypothetical protein